jgi:predicted MFS family arabinose efflux permease
MQNQRNESVSSLNIEILEKVKRESRYKSGLEMTLMGFVISMCAIMFGYGLTEISTIPIQTLVDKYHIPMAPSLAQGLLIGIMPFGGIFGAILFKYLLASLRRRTSIFFISIWMMVSIVLVEITTVETLFLGRFL